MGLYLGLHISPTAQTVLNRFTGNLNVALISAINRLVNAEVANGNWDLYKQILFTGFETETNSLTDWTGFVNATNVGCTHTPWSGVGHSGFAGYSSADDTEYIDTNLAPSDMNQNNVFAFMFTGPTVHQNLIWGANTATNQVFNYRGSAGNRINFNQNSNFQITHPAAAYEMFGGRRTSSTAIDFIVNGVIEDSTSIASTTPSTYTIYLNGQNGTGVAAGGGTLDIQLWIAGAAVGFDHAAAYTNWNKFLTNLGIV